MAKYKDTILTAKGLEFATKAANGDFKFNITKVETSGTDLSDKSEADLKALTALPDVIGTGSIVGRDDGKKDNGVVGTQVQITNIGLEKSYTLNTFGLWAKADGEDTEYLYAIAVAEKDHGEYIPDFNDKVTLTFGVTIYVIVGDTDQVTVQFDPAGLATIEFVENAVAGIDLSKYVLKDDLETLLPKGIVSLSEDGKSVTAATKNGEQTGIFVTQAFLDSFKQSILDQAGQNAKTIAEKAVNDELDTRNAPKY
ncbi:hypothetical protein [Secundilactobacillus kimchicus]|uniref:hypothetical protein n=1 Tax=Secundilactobacillus kimchicus TaxID=528209 RepID=UPI0024A7C934|nr:hypothetical protein [Secundilactobacillus kimchicus]